MKLKNVIAEKHATSPDEMEVAVPAILLHEAGIEVDAKTPVGRPVTTTIGALRKTFGLSRAAVEPAKPEAPQTIGDLKKVPAVTK